MPHTTRRVSPAVGGTSTASRPHADPASRPRAGIAAAARTSPRCATFVAFGYHEDTKNTKAREVVVLKRLRVPSRPS
jgi:hypothetical protein